MSGPRLTFRPNLSRDEHRKAWELLQAVPQGQRVEYIVQAILWRDHNNDLESLLRRVIKEEMSEIPRKTASAEELEIPAQMLNFLNSLSG